MRVLIRAALLSLFAAFAFAPIAIAQDPAPEPKPPVAEDEAPAVEDASEGWAVDAVAVYGVERKPGITFTTIDPETADEPRSEGPATERVLELKLDLFLPVAPRSEEEEEKETDGDTDTDTDDDGEGDADGDETVTPDDDTDTPPAELRAYHDGPYPLVIYIHGGGWKGGNRNAIGGFGEMFAKAGFVCASIDYRLSPAWHAPAHVRDCKAALYFLLRNAEQYSIDPDRVMVWGTSAGGHLTMMLACSDPDDVDGWMEPPLAEGETAEDRAKVNGPIQCAVPFFGPADLRGMGDPERNEAQGTVTTVQNMLGLGPDDEGFERAANAMSPITLADKNDPPVLCVHGGRDRLVPPAHSEALVEALEKAGASPGYLLYDEASHGLHRDSRFADPSWWALFNWACAYLYDGERRDPLDANPFAVGANPYGARNGGAATGPSTDGEGEGDPEAGSEADAEFDAIVTRRFESQDKDGDGAVSREEWSGNPRVFDRLDTDGDGALAFEEFKAGLEGRRRGNRDRDQDGNN